MWTVAIWFFVFMYAINGFALFLDSVVDDYSINQPFSNSTIVLPTQPTVTDTLGNITATTATNSTGGDSISVWEAIDYGWNSTMFVVNMLTGGFIFDVIEGFVPNSGDTAIIFGLFQGTIGFFLILTVLHFWRGIL